MENIIELFRYKIFTRCNILVNNMDDVIKEVNKFAYEKVFPYVLEIEGCDKLVFDNIEIRVEDKNIKCSKYVKDDIYEVVTTKINMDEINDFFKGKDEFLKELQDNGFSEFPKELYGKAFMCLAEVLSDILFREELIEEILNIFDICILSNNGKCNVIYELQ
jgi:hypothetical protein